MLETDICIIGAGPAGTTFASRLAGFGHRVCLVERAKFPRAHLGESLSPGVLPLLEVISARDAVEAAGFTRVKGVCVNWDQGPQWRQDPRQEGLLADRGRLDALLLNHAKRFGVKVLQPAILREHRWNAGAWRLCVETHDGIVELRTKFLADASGRAAALPSRKRRTGRRTLALYAYWRGRSLPENPRIEAGADAWYWGVPLPGGLYNTLVFVDSEQFRSEPRVPLATRFHELLSRSGLRPKCRDAHLESPVLASDATPNLDDECVTPCSIKVGDAVLAIDPLSSSGVQKAIQNALAGAVVVNTLLRKPEKSAAAIQFFRDSVNRASNAHCRWAAEHYEKIAQSGGGTFWQLRSSQTVAPLFPAPAIAFDERTSPDEILEISPLLKFVDVPCLDGQFVTIKTAVSHPNLESSVVYVGNCEIAPLLKDLRDGMTPIQIAHSWSTGISLQAGLTLVGWLLRNGILVRRQSRLQPEMAADKTLDRPITFQ